MYCVMHINKYQQHKLEIKFKQIDFIEQNCSDVKTAISILYALLI